MSMGTQDGSGKGSDGQTYSLELCGGTHVARTGDIGEFVLLGDSASSAGVRRIEALTGAAAGPHNRHAQDVLAAALAEFKCTADELVDRIRAEQAKTRSLSNEVAQLRRDLAMGSGATDGPAAKEINGIKLIAQVVTGVTGKDLPPLIDAHKEKLGSGAVLLIADTGGKAAVAAGVTSDMTGKVSAVDLVKAAVPELGGKGGGGRPDMAQGGGASADNADAAIAAVEKLLEG